MKTEELRSGERLKMRHWLKRAIDSGEFEGVEWTDREEGKFRVPWKHASRHGWDINRDASIFKMWAVYTGKYTCGNRTLSEREKRSLAKLWKANFRCALNALHDIQVMKDEGKRRGRDAYKVFKLLPQEKQKSKVTKMRTSSTGSLDIKKEDNEDDIPLITPLPANGLDSVSDHTYHVQRFGENPENLIRYLQENPTKLENEFPQDQWNMMIDPEIDALSDSDAVSGGSSPTSSNPEISSVSSLFSDGHLIEVLSNNLQCNTELRENLENGHVLTQYINYSPDFLCGPDPFLMGYCNKAQVLQDDPSYCIFNAGQDYHNL